MPNPIRSLPSIGVTLNVEMDNCIPGQSHEMVSIKMGEECPVKFIERCHRCGWIDEASLQWWVEDALKQSLSKRAQRIALAASETPFAFIQMPDEELTLEEILFQALGAASVCWIGGTGEAEFDSSRAKEIGLALIREVNRALEMAQHSGKQWMDLAYELYALACNSAPGEHGKPGEWQGAFERLRDQFNAMLPKPAEKLIG